ncbi:MAG: long-chain fatty acid--CoA ligase [Gammaproteobacteria bacterium]
MILEQLIQLTDIHKLRCKAYSDFTLSMFPNTNIQSLSDLPYLPVRAFKEFNLFSVAPDDVFKIMTSSGTSGRYSKIYLDKETAQLQSKALIKIFTDTFSKSRFPMLVIDAEATVRDKKQFSARTAAINGFSLFSRGRCFALDDNMALNLDRVEAFIEKQRGQPIFVFGFTFLIWKQFVQVLLNMNKKLDLSNAFFLHGGGWKKLQDESVSNDQYKSQILNTTGCCDVRNYYGMIEQTGTIFMECRNGNLHASEQSDVLVRDVTDHLALDHEKEGIIQVFSSIQRSYPGHSLLTEDIGCTLSASTCRCGHPGTIVKIYGRLAQAEVRGCSDAHT